MAKRQKDLAGWSLVFELEDLPSADSPALARTPTRRSRRTETTSETTSVFREADNTTLKVADCVLLSGTSRYINNKGDTYVAVITDIRHGIHNLLEISVLPFTTDDLPGAAPHELLLVPESESILLRNVVEKVQVLSATQFAEIAPDSSISNLSYFMCQRATDRHCEQRSPDFDFAEWRTLLRADAKQAINFLAEQTLVIISPSKSTLQSHSVQQRLHKLSSPLRRTYTEVSGSSSEEDFSDLSDDEDVKEEQDDPHPVSASLSPSKRRLAAPLTPRKRRKGQHDSNVIKQLANVLSPLNKGFKVKSAASAASLPSLSRTLSLVTDQKSSDAFRELKEKLHTSTRVALLPCREDQFADVYMSLESAVAEKTGCCLYISGTPGVGKTATIREAIGALRDNVNEGYMDDFDFVEINCLKLISPISAYEKLWEHLTDIKVTPSNAALLLEEYFSRRGADRKPLIVLMDELDQLVTKNQKVIYNFFNWPTYPDSRLIVLAVANTMDLPERALSNKIASRLGLRRFAFRGYTEQELGIIIAHRLTLLSEENKRKVNIAPDAMRYASKKVALVSGDARRALTICRRAVEIAETEYLENTDTSGVAEEDQTYSVKISHIGLAIAETVNAPVAQFLDALLFAAKLVLVGVLLRIRRSGSGENPLGDVLDEMRNSLKLLTTKGSTHALRKVSESETFYSLLYGSPADVRISQLGHVIKELVEQGILMQQNVRSDRFRLVSLGVSEDEVSTVLRRDPDIAAML